MGAWPSLPIIRDTIAGTTDVAAVGLLLDLAFRGELAELLTVWYFAISQTIPKTLRQSSINDHPILATTQGLHGERCRFNHASVTRDHTVCKKGPAIPEASCHFLVLVLILRATIPMATILATPSLRPSWRRRGTWRLGGS